MKCSSFIAMLFMSAVLFAQESEENEILRVAALRQKFERNIEVKVYPNPSTDNRVSIEAEQGANYKLVTLSGEIILSGVFEEQRIELTELFPGTYLLLTEKDGRIDRSKIVVL
jgi:hypothetical protein